MAIKYKIKKDEYEKLSPEMKREYVQDGDGYQADIDGLEDTSALKRAKDRHKQNEDDLRTKNQELTETNERLERGKAGDVDKLTRRYDTEKADLIKSHGEALSKKDGFITRTIKDAAANALAAKLNPKSPKVFLPHVNERLDIDMSGDEPKLIIKGVDGKPSKMTMDDLQKEFVANKDFAGIIIGSQASGGAGTGHKNKLPVSDGSNNGPGDDGKPVDLSRMSPREHAARIKEQKAQAAADNNSGS